MSSSRVMSRLLTAASFAWRLLPAHSAWRWRIAQQGELSWWTHRLQTGAWRAEAPTTDQFLDHRRHGLERRQRAWNVDLSPYLNADRLTLDLGCGPYSLLGLPRVVAVDPLVRGYGRLVDLRADDTTIYVEAKGETLPFADDYFDTVWSRNVLDHVHRPARLLGEALRVLKPGGYFVLVFDKQSEGGILHPHTALSPAWVRERSRTSPSFEVLEQTEVGEEHLMVLRKAQRARIPADQPRSQLSAADGGGPRT